MDFSEIFNLSKEFSVFVVLAIIRTYLVDILGWQMVIKYLEKTNWDNQITKKIRLNIYSFAHLITFILSSLLSYLLNRFVTFNSKQTLNEYFSILTFFTVNLFTLFLSTILLNYLTSLDKDKLIFSKFDIIDNNWIILSKIFTVVVTMFINYFAYKIFIFT